MVYYGDEIVRFDWAIKRLLRQKAGQKAGQKVGRKPSMMSYVT